jgi:hypothetical protein
MGEKIGNRYYYSGVVHVHTTESDGTKSLEEVVGYGKEVGLDFLMFADHMNLNNRENGKEGFYDNLLVVIGYEHNDPDDNNHYLIYKSPSVYPGSFSVNEYVKAADADSSLGIIAHPDEVRNRMGKYPPYPWTDWSIDGFQGIELWNQMSEWMEMLTPSNKLFMAFSPRKSMVAPTDRILRIWDEINLTRKCAGIASADAHAFPIAVGPMTVEIFPYKVHFRSLRTYIHLDEPLSADFKIASGQLYSAIKDCRLFFANIRWGNPMPFIFSASNGKNDVSSGGQLDDMSRVKLFVSVPSKATLRIIRNNEKVHETQGRSLEYQVEQPGIYRVEAWKGRRGWIFSNHIRIGHDRSK